MSSPHLTLRKWHRRAGIILALFIVIQAGTGLLLSFESFEPAVAHADGDSDGQYEHEISFEEVLEDLHTGGGAVGGTYRIILGLGLLFMATTGTMIFFKFGMKK